MRTQIATTKEESLELIEQGLNPNSADMYYTEDGTLIIGRYEEAVTHNSNITPAWSASALWDILPRQYVYPQEMCGYKEWSLTLEKQTNESVIDDLGYEHVNTDGGYYYDTDMCSGKTLVECLCKLVFCALRGKRKGWADFPLFDKPI